MENIDKPVLWISVAVAVAGTEKVARVSNKVWEGEGKQTIACWKLSFANMCVCMFFSLYVLGDLSRYVPTPSWSVDKGWMGMNKQLGTGDKRKDREPTNRVGTEDGWG